MEKREENKVDGLFAQKYDKSVSDKQIVDKLAATGPPRRVRALRFISAWH